MQSFFNAAQLPITADIEPAAILALSPQPTLPVNAFYYDNK